jgi:tetratricopeptide (TPR) repeat protein
MRPALTHHHSLSVVLFLLVVALALSGCVKEVQLNVVTPAQVNTSGIQKVAIGRFELAGIRYVSRIERNGKWQQEEHSLSAEQLKALGNQIRARVISSLATIPYFDLVYTDEFAALETDAALQDAIAAGGFRTSEADAVINGKVWLDVIHIDGVEIDKAELEYLQGGREGAFNYNLEVLVYWPFKSINGTMDLELKMTRLNPTAVVAVTFDSRSYSHAIGGKPADLQRKIETGAQNLRSVVTTGTAATDHVEESDLVLPNFEQLVADLAESIASQFVRRVSLSQTTARYTIAPGGDSATIQLIEAGAYEKAIAVLTETLNRPGEKNPDDLYNLGLCFEVTGDFGLAAVTYADALRLKPDKLLYAQGIGRIDRLKREDRRLQQQLATKR